MTICTQKNGKGMRKKRNPMHRHTLSKKLSVLEQAFLGKVPTASNRKYRWDNATLMMQFLTDSALIINWIPFINFL